MECKSELPMALRAAYLTMHRMSDAAFSRHGITADQFVLLATLHRGQPMTQRELAATMTSDPSTVRAMLVLLESRGLVSRASNPSDARANVVTLTELGQNKYRQAWESGEAIRTQLYESIPIAELAAFLRNLRGIAHLIPGIAATTA